VLSVGPGARQFSPSQDLPVGESPPVGNLHYRHRPGYRLEVKTAGSAVSGSGRVAQLCLVVREFLFFGMEWPGKLAIWKCSGCRKESGRAREVLRGWRALFASREAEARYRCREYSRTEEDVGTRVWRVNRPKARSHQKGNSPWITLENVDVTFLLLRRARFRGMIMIVGSTGFG
jgi:hypothetical protein